MVCMLRFLGYKQKGWLVASGFLTGLASVFRHDVGVYAAGSQALALATFVLVNTERPFAGIAMRMARLTLLSLPYVAGFALPVLPSVIYLVRTVPGDRLFYSFVLFPLQISPSLRSSLPPDIVAIWYEDISWIDVMNYMILTWLPFYAPIFLHCIAILISAVGIFKGTARGNATRKLDWTILPAVFGVGLFNQALNRPDPIHLLPTSIVALPVLAALTYNISKTSRWKSFTVAQRHRLLVRMSPILVFLVMSCACRSVLVGLQVSSATLWPSSFASDLHETDHTLIPYGQAQAIQFVQDRVDISEKIFVGNIRHDQFARNDAMFYFLSGRANATRYDDLVATGVHTLAVQEDIARDLEASTVRYLVLFSGPFHFIDLSQRRFSSGVSFLDDFIRGHYIKEYEYGNYSVWVRR
jgi:hypothetical protein